MPWGQFSKVAILPDDLGLEVSGPYDPGITGQQTVLGDVFIGFLIIQNDRDGNPTVIVDDVAKWTFAPPDANGEYEGWRTVVPMTKVRAAGFEAHKETRAIGTVVQVTDYAPNDKKVPPGVATFTWCVNQVVEQL
jgi:hypothetical protein